MLIVVALVYVMCQACRLKGEGELGACIARVSIAEPDESFAEGSLQKNVMSVKLS